LLDSYCVVRRRSTWHRPMPPSSSPQKAIPESTQNTATNLIKFIHGRAHRPSSGTHCQGNSSLRNSRRIAHCPQAAGSSYLKGRPRVEALQYPVHSRLGGTLDGSYLPAQKYLEASLASVTTAQYSRVASTAGFAGGLISNWLLPHVANAQNRRYPKSGLGP